MSVNNQAFYEINNEAGSFDSVIHADMLDRLTSANIVDQNLLTKLGNKKTYLNNQEELLEDKRAWNSRRAEIFRR
ncbi:MAG: hypothetical protein ACIPMY_06225 [Rickettsia endosymbiont of Pentastiridius leporinus]